MKRPGRLKKVLLWSLGLLLATVTGLWITARLYLASHQANQQVVAHLEHLLGGKVRIASTSIGIVGDSSLQDVEIYEKDAPADSKPWLRCAAIDADVSVLDLMGRKNAPGQVNARGAEVALRFDREGKLQTELPDFTSGDSSLPLPRITLKESKLTLTQEGRGEMVIAGLDASLTASAEGLAIEGTIQDRFWGEWNLRGNLALASGAIHLQLSTDGAEVTQEKLEALAFVPANVWKNVKARGTTPVQFTLDIIPAAEGKANLHYRAELSPEGTTITIPAIDLTARNARGKVIVEDGLVQLREVVGQTADGTIRVARADLDFRTEPSTLQFDAIGVENVLLSQLPASWKLTEEVDIAGRLTGQSSLQVVIPARAPVYTRGSGEGQISPARVAGFATRKPIHLHLHAEGQEFRFSTNLDAVANAFPPKGGQSPPTMHAGRGTIATLAVLLSLGQVQPLAKTTTPNYLEVQFSLKDIDLAELLRRLKVKPPFPIKGQISLAVQAAIPYETPGEVKAYRLRGDVNLSRLEFAGLQLEDVQAQITLARGVLELKELSARLPQEQGMGDPGLIAGSARLGVDPPGDFHADVKLNRIPAGRLATLFPLQANQIRGTFSGSLKARVPARALTTPAAWQARASLRADSLGLYGLKLANLAADLDVRAGQARFTALKVQVEGNSVVGRGEAKLTGSYPFRFQVDLEKGDLSVLNRLAPEYKLPFQVAGSLHLGAEVSGTLRSWKYSLKGSLQATRLSLGGFHVESLSLRWEQGSKTIALRDIKILLAGGEIAGSAELPVANGEKGTVLLRLKELDVEQLLKPFPQVKIRIKGKATGEMTAVIEPAREDQSRLVKGKIDLSTSRLLAGGFPLEKVKGTVDYQDGKANYRLAGRTFGFPVPIQGQIPPAPPKTAAMASTPP
jgi:hypothetical protein